MPSPIETKKNLDNKNQEVPCIMPIKFRTKTKRICAFEYSVSKGKS